MKDQKNKITDLLGATRRNLLRTLQRTSAFLLRKRTGTTVTAVEASAVTATKTLLYCTSDQMSATWPLARVRICAGSFKAALLQSQPDISSRVYISCIYIFSCFVEDRPSTHFSEPALSISVFLEDRPSTPSSRPVFVCHVTASRLVTLLLVQASLGFLFQGSPLLPHEGQPSS